MYSTLWRRRIGTFSRSSRNEAHLWGIICGVDTDQTSPHGIFGVECPWKTVWRPPRIRHLQKAPVSVRFLSIEPLLGPIGDIDIEGISWVIVGGESGPKARPMKPCWVLDIRDLCQRQGIPFFFKQWGGRTPKSGGRLLEGIEHNAKPAHPNLEQENALHMAS